MRELERATDELRRLNTRGAIYWDLRLEVNQHEFWMMRDGVPHQSFGREKGVGLRILFRDPGHGRQGWGFASSSLLDSASLRSTAERALEAARASSLLPSTTLEFDPSRETGEWLAAVEEDPFALAADVKRSFVRDLDSALQADDVVSRMAFLQFDRVDRYFRNSAGADLLQRFCWHGSGISATVRGQGRTQTRNYPNTGGNVRLGGFEGIRAYDYSRHCPILLQEAREILAADECPSERAVVVLGPKMLGLLVHEVCGHATELDRILGEEAAYAGTSFLRPEDLGRLRYGSEAVNMVSDPSYPGTAASCGWDDDGSPVRQQFLVRRGLVDGFLSGRANCACIGQPSAAANRAASWRYQPINRITSVNFLPGDSLRKSEIIASIARGYWLDDFCGWSIDSDRGGFRFSVEDMRRIENGRLGERLRNGSFSARSTSGFFSSCFAVASDPPWVAGYANCAKGQPVQVIRVGHVVPQAAAFRDVKVGR